MILQAPDPDSAQLVDLLAWFAMREDSIADALIRKSGDRPTVAQQAAAARRRAATWRARAERGK